MPRFLTSTAILDVKGEAGAEVLAAVNAIFAERAAFRESSTLPTIGIFRLIAPGIVLGAIAFAISRIGSPIAPGIIEVAAEATRVAIDAIKENLRNAGVLFVAFGLLLTLARQAIEMAAAYRVLRWLQSGDGEE